MMVQWIVTSCALILVVLALRAALGGRISARLRYALWLAVLARLLIPVPLYTAPVAAVVPGLPAEMEEKSIYFIPTDSAPVEDAASIGAVVLEDGQVGVASSMGYARLEDEGNQVVLYLDKISPAQLLCVLWAAGSIVTLGVLLWSNLRFGCRLRRSRRALEGAACRLPVYAAQGLPSPCLFGLLRPAIYVTPQAAEDGMALSHVLAHEETHYRHRDHVWSFLRCAALAVHWWNPLVWLAVVLSKRDGELACDEGALRKLGDGERRAYGETLLKLVTAPTRPADLFSCATTMTGGKRSLAERIRRIACQPKHLVSAAISVILLSVLALGCAFAGAEEVAAADGEDTPSQEGYFLQEELPNQPDLNHDGELEALLLMATDDKWEYGLWVTQGTDILWSGYAAQAHAGWNALFLLELDGEDFLLEYQPKMFQGVCDYSYRVFSLDENGEEMIRDERQISFDINFGQPDHSFDSEELAFFLESVNSYLAEATELLNTDEMLLGSFLKNGRLLDTQAGWLDYDPESGVTLEDALRRYEGEHVESYYGGSQVDGRAVQAAYEAITANYRDRPFTATVEYPVSSARTETSSYTIGPKNGYNVEHVGIYLPVSYFWYAASEEDWSALTAQQRGTTLTLSDGIGNIFQCCAGSNLVRLTMGGAVRYLRAVPDSDPEDVYDDSLFSFAMMIAQDAASQWCWDNAAVDGGNTDLEEVARLLAEQVAENFMALPDWAERKPLDVLIAENDERVFDVYWGEPAQFCCDLGFRLALDDANTIYWEAGAGLSEPERINGMNYYDWGVEALILRDAERNLWYIAGCGTGGYTVNLPGYTLSSGVENYLGNAPLEELFDMILLTEGFTHDYLLPNLVLEKPEGQLSEINDVLSRYTEAEQENICTCLAGHLTRGNAAASKKALENLRELLSSEYHQYLP